MNTYSVIIATHRRADWLKRAVISVKSQSFKHISIIIVSDVVCEETLALVLPLLDSSDLFVQRWGNAGPANSRNIGIRLSTSDYVLFLDDDDELPIDFVKNMDARRPDNFRGILYSDFEFHLHTEDGTETPKNYDPISFACRQGACGCIRPKLHSQ